jgi:outer membrane protein TolC
LTCQELFDVIFEILQSARSMHLFGNFTGIALLGAAGAFVSANTAAAQNELGSSTIPVTAGMRTNAVTLTATNFVAGAAGVTNGVFVSDTFNVPPTSIFGTNVAVRPLTLEDAIQQAITQNFDVQVARFSPEIARFTLQGDYAVYDPTFSTDPWSHSYRKQPGAGIDPSTGLPKPAAEFSTDTIDGNLGPGLGGYGPGGFRYALGMSLTRTSPTIRDPVTGDASIQVRQPLLRNFWIDSSRATILIDKKRLKIAEWQLRLQLMVTIANVENAYYELIRTRENIKVQRAALDYNNQLLRENKKRVEVGALAPLDEKQAESEVASGVATLLLTEQAYAVAENNLKVLLTQDFASLSNVLLDPVETLVAVPANPELPESWKRGLTMRPEIQQSRLDLEARDINLKFLKNQLWPSLDLSASYGHLAQGSSFEDGFNNLGDDRFPHYSYGVVLSFPLGNIGPRNALKSAKANKAQALLQYKQLEQNIMATIDNAIKLLQSQFQKVEATRQARLFAQDALAAEQKKYENGKSTSFLVLQFQRDLTARRFDELSALADYNKALAGLSSAEGTTLSRHNLDINLQ